MFGDLSNSKIVDQWLDAVGDTGSAPALGEMLHAYRQEQLDRELELLKEAAARKSRVKTEV